MNSEQDFELAIECKLISQKGIENDNNDEECVYKGEDFLKYDDQEEGINFNE